MQSFNEEDCSSTANPKRSAINTKAKTKFNTRRWRYLDQLVFSFIALIVLVLCQTIGMVSAGNSRSVGQPRLISCPPAHEILPCTCKVITKGLDVVCDKANEKHILNALDILKNIAFKIYWMKFRNCMLPRIKDYIFLGLDVRHLNIIRSNVSVIDGSSLSALGATLTDLDLSHNQIRTIPTSALGKIKSLNFLNLNYNRIKVIPANAFTGLAMLERLSLYENEINHIHDNAFKGLRKLTRLNLGKNKLSQIPTDTFHPLKNLLVLDLNENQIKHLPDGAFLGLHKLDMLKLEHNEIDTIQENVFSDLKMLNSLNVEHNKIHNVSHRAFAGLESNLGWLEIGHNLLDHIPSYALRPLHNLRQLDLDSNNIVDMPEDAFRGYGDTLKFLLMDRNDIKEIPPLTFIDLHSLEWLKLSHNELRMFTEDTVQPILDTLKHIDISNNPLICNCEIYWLYRWMKDPINSDNVESTDDHRCTLERDNSAHIIKLLSEDSFNCNHMSSTTEKSLDWPFLSSESPASPEVTISSTQANIEGGVTNGETVQEGSMASLAVNNFLNIMVSYVAFWANVLLLPIVL